MSAPTKDVSKWDLDDFMQFVESVGIKKGTTNYTAIKTTMEENSLSVSDDVKGSAVSLASLFGIHKVIATKIQKPLYKLRLSEGINETINTPEHKQNNQKLNNSVNNNEKFCINFRGKQGKALTLRTLFTANDTIGSVAEAYKAEECVNQSYKVEKIILQSGGQVLNHDKKLSYYNITNENNLITIIFKTKGGANFASRTVEQWTTDDIQSWIKTLNFQKDDEQKIIDAINDNGLTGGDLKDESCDDIAALLDISNELSKVLHDGFSNWKVIEDTDNVSDMKLNENKDDQSDQSDMKYYPGYKLDCKDNCGMWCPAEVISVDSSFITVKFVNWTNSKTRSQYHEDTIYCNEFAERLEKYGIITNQSSKAKAIILKKTSRKYLNNNVCVYKKKRNFHPTKKAAKQIRKSQAEKLKKLVNNNESDGWMKSLTSYIPGYNSGYNGYNNGYNGYNNGYNGYNN
eukprot:861014_1